MGIAYILEGTTSEVKTVHVTCLEERLFVGLDLPVVKSSFPCHVQVFVSSVRDVLIKAASEYEAPLVKMCVCVF